MKFGYFDWYFSMKIGFCVSICQVLGNMLSKLSNGFTYSFIQDLTLAIRHTVAYWHKKFVKSSSKETVQLFFCPNDFMARVLFSNALLAYLAYVKVGTFSYFDISLVALLWILELFCRKYLSYSRNSELSYFGVKLLDVCGNIA